MQNVFSVVPIGINQNAINYNVGEQPAPGSAVSRGQAATMGFWQNKNGQALILKFGSIGNWLADTMPQTFGGLTGASPQQVALLYQQQFVLKDKLDAQVMATALSVYATNISLGGIQATISAHTPLFMPVQNSEWSNPDTPSNVPGNYTAAELAHFADVQTGATIHLSMTIDGHAIPEATLFTRRETAPIFSYNFPKTHNLAQVFFGEDISGRVSPAAADGYYVMLQPLSKGLHTIVFGGQSIEVGGFSHGGGANTDFNAGRGDRLLGCRRQSAN